MRADSKLAAMGPERNAAMNTITMMIMMMNTT